MAIRLIQPAPEPAVEVAPSLTAGTALALLVDSVERQTRIIGLCADGFGEVARKVPKHSPLRRYANILTIANEQLRQDLRALLDEVRA